MVYVDAAINRWKGKLWCHLTSDSLTELQEFAGRLGLKKEWFQNHRLIPHYDITENKRAIAIQLGAIAITTEERIKKVKERLNEIHSREPDTA
ncbi:DUF4031 domain-containing protein [Pseudanabaena sp. 'Roaring Creek']|uniref:DUF4031 domain-containing protein n=1 Tax=Pseudanabaena sp. 'Roaring Creek' TaxID=1681830 RepID=UPI00092E45BF|nr:DUF4031 domain-containing protein [Pseudanabaena sp. 'Roaring Creek']